MEILFIVIGIAVVLFLVVALAIHFYTVVEPNKAHVVVAFGGGRKIYHPSRDGSKSAYFFIPIFMQRIIVSLENVKHEINNIELWDSQMAPFKVDITCWFKINNPDFAAEKLDVDSEGSVMESIRATLNAQVQGVVRAASMKQEILELMKDRTNFGKSVFQEVNGDLDEWGVQLVKLEIIDFSDMEGSNVIQDYEARREAEISSGTRIIVAEKDQLAKIKEAEAKEAAETARIKADREIEMRDLEKKETTGVRDQSAQLKIAQQTEKANEQQVKADKTALVGDAKNQAEAKIALAEGEKTSTIRLAEGQAQEVELKGKADATVIENTGTAEAVAVEKKAEAQKKFVDVSKDIEMAKIAADIQKVKFTSMAEAIKEADVQIISKDMSFLGFGAETGAGLGVAIENLQKNSDVDLSGIVEKLTGDKPGSGDKKQVKSK